MIEIRDTFQDAEIETLQVSRGRSMGRGHRPPHPTRRSEGASLDPPEGSGAERGAPVENGCDVV